MQSKIEHNFIIQWCHQNIFTLKQDFIHASLGLFLPPGLVWLAVPSPLPQVTKVVYFSGLKIARRNDNHAKEVTWTEDGG
jgi:hypothetical protein